MRRLILAAAALSLLAACQGTDTRVDAAGDVHAFLTAVKDDDRTTFDAHVDRDALSSHLTEQFVAQARAQGAEEAMARALARGAADEMITPGNFRTAWTASGAGDRVPSQAEIAAGLRVLSESEVCVPSAPGREDCVLTFARTGETWRLTRLTVSDVSVDDAAPASAPAP